MLSFIFGAVIGATVFFLVLRNNPKLAEKILKVVDRIDDKLSETKK